MSTITKEQAQKIIEAADEVITALAGTNEDVHPESDSMLRLWDDLNDRYAPPEVVRELSRIALASLDAGPVVITDDMAYAFHHALSDSSLGADEVEEIKTGLRAAFANVTAPPSPVSVPDEVRQALSRMDDEIIAELDAEESACRAAMLQDAEIVESRCSIQTASALDSLPKNAESRCSNSPVIPDGWVLVPKEPTPAMLNAAWVSHGIYHASAYRTMLAAAPQQNE